MKKLGFNASSFGDNGSSCFPSSQQLMLSPKPFTHEQSSPASHSLATDSHAPLPSFFSWMEAGLPSGLPSKRTRFCALTPSHKGGVSEDKGMEVMGTRTSCLAQDEGQRPQGPFCTRHFMGISWGTPCGVWWGAGVQFTDLRSRSRAG